jgi:hypothetical protein
MHTLSVDDGSSFFSMIKGTENSILVPKALANKLQSSKPRSVISIHNHPSNAGFSGADLYLFLKYDSFLISFVVANNGTIYYVKKRKDVMYVPKDMKMVWDFGFMVLFNYYRQEVLELRMTENEAKEAHTHEVMDRMWLKNQFDYYKVTPDAVEITLP